MQEFAVLFPTKPTRPRRRTPTKKPPASRAGSLEASHGHAGTGITPAGAEATRRQSEVGPAWFKPAVRQLVTAGVLRPGQMPGRPARRHARRVAEVECRSTFSPGCGVVAGLAFSHQSQGSWLMGAVLAATLASPMVFVDGSLAEVLSCRATSASC